MTTLTNTTFEDKEEAGLVSDAPKVDTTTMTPSIKRKTNIAKDKWNLCLLLLLYFLQGVPLGLCGSISAILAFRGIPYSALGTFSFVYWPFSLKLLWAPVVDSIYIKRIGRRKSWLILVQTLIALFLLAFASYVQKALYTASTKGDIIILTLIFFTMTFLVSVQDIAVDGWALTMLSKENVSLQSACNAIGQTFGVFIASSILIILESPKFSNRYLRLPLGFAEKPDGIVTISAFMYFFGAVYFMTTICVLIFKRERIAFSEEELREQEAIQMTAASTAGDEEAPPTPTPRTTLRTPNLLATYKLIYKIVLIKPVQKLSFVLLTMQTGMFIDAVYGLKLIEYGVSKETLSLFNIPLTPLTLILSAVLTKHLNGPKPFTMNLIAIPVRTVLCLVFTLTIYFIPHFRGQGFPALFLLYLFLLLASKACMYQVMFVSRMAFFARVSDPLIGGTYITLLNTLSNLGTLYPETFGLYLVDFFGVKSCLQNAAVNATISGEVVGKRCSSLAFEKICAENGGKCVTTFESIHVLTAVFAVLGFIWLFFFGKYIKQLDAEPLENWKISHLYKPRKKRTSQA